MRKILVWLRNPLLILCSLLIIACSATPEPVREVGPTEYFIGPGDNLNIFIWRNPELSTTVPVRPDGKISIPLVEDMVAVGKTPSDLARDIEKVLSEYVRSPKVNVIVTDFVGQFNQQIRVVGQAANPKALSYRKNISLLDVIIEVGGLGEHAAGNRAKIVRRYGGEQSVIKVNVEDLIDEGDMNQNVTMYPGDILIIPETWF
jgi:polysaccharide export outer membrane protein